MTVLLKGVERITFGVVYLNCEIKCTCTFASNLQDSKKKTISQNSLPLMLTIAGVQGKIIFQFVFITSIVIMKFISTLFQ